MPLIRVRRRPVGGGLETRLFCGANSAGMHFFLFFGPTLSSSSADALGGGLEIRLFSFLRRELGSPLRYIFT
jgi:hypothetical protein